MTSGQALLDRNPHRHHVLQVLHSRPGELGGTEKHFWRLMQAMSGEFDFAVFQPCASGFLLSTLWSSGTGPSTKLEFLIPGEPGRTAAVDDPAAASALETVLDMFDFDAVHLQNIVHHSLAPLAVLADFDGPVSCSVRDLYLACPHHWLLYRNEQSCGIPEDLTLCARCLPETRHLDLAYLEAFRETARSRLDTIDHWVFASQSAVDFLLRVYDLDPDRIEIIEHGAIIDVERAPRALDRSLVLDEPLRLAFVGIGWAKKGLPVVNELAERLAGTTIELHHFGELRDSISPSVHAHGPYDNEMLPELLHRAGIQVVLLPGPFVETFGHVMTEALIAGLPVIGSRHGALGERIRKHQVGWTIDSEDLSGTRALIENLDRCRLELLRATQRVAQIDVQSVASTVARYAALYRSETVGVSSVAGADREIRRSDNERLRRELKAVATMNRRLEGQLSKLSGSPATPTRLARRVVPSLLRRARAAIVTRGFRAAGQEASRRVVRRTKRGIRR
ncbi:MAG: glycosyltransferase [Acidimicrobiales bacterium]